MHSLPCGHYHWSNKLLYCYFLAVLVWAPLPTASNRPWSMELLAGLLLAGLGLAVVLLVARKLSWPPALRRAWPALAALVLVQCWVGVQLTTGVTDYPSVTRRALLLGCGLTSGFVLTLLLVDSAHRVSLTLRVMLLAAVGQAFFAGMMMFSDVQELAFLDKTFRRSSANGTFGNRNHLAGFLQMSLALGIGMLVAQLHRGGTGSWREFIRRSIDTILSRKFRLRLYLVLMVIALVLTRSRMGNTAFFSSLLICGVLGMALQRRLNWATVLFLGSLLLVDLYIVGNWFGVDEVVQRIQNTTLETELRDEVAADALAMWKQNFWVGTGAGTFGWAYYYGGFVSEGLPFHRYVHNDYLEIGVTFGFIGLGLLAVAVLASLWQALMAQRHRHSRLMQGLGFGVTMGVISLLIHSFADFNLHIPANSLWFVVLLAFGWVARYTEVVPSGNGRPVALE